MQSSDPWFRLVDWCAVGLLAAGCTSGILALLLRTASPAPAPQPPAAPETSHRRV